jgi:hypothetical protein
MTSGRNLIMTMFLAATILLVSTRASDAQDQTPPPRMLLNLDLFAPQPGDSQSGASGSGGESTLEQLRALRAMGYLSPDGPLPEVDDSDQAGDAPHTVQRSQGTAQ